MRLSRLCRDQSASLLLRLKPLDQWLKGKPATRASAQGLPAKRDRITAGLLGFGAIPAAAVVYLRTKMPESPRFQARVQGQAGRAMSELVKFADGAVSAPATAVDDGLRRVSLRGFLSDRRMLRILVGTSAAWFLFDYAYYGNTLSLPVILKDVAPQASLIVKLLWTLAIFVVFAVPGYAFAVAAMDRIGHRRLQLIGFSVMAVAFLCLGAVPVLTTVVGLFLAVFGLSYFFVEFGPNVTTFVLPSEVYPVSMRTTGHGVAAGIGKLGAFIGVFLVPELAKSVGLRPMLLVAGGSAVAGYLVTLVLPEPARRDLEEVSGEDRDEARRLARNDALPMAPMPPAVSTKERP
jgi:MFS transporter, PHS family, inorganic phosphate transporter